MIYYKYAICDDNAVSRHKTARLLAEDIINLVFGIKNENTLIKNEPNGKPYIKDGVFDISISHTGSLAVVAVCGNGKTNKGICCIDENVAKVGVDIECADRNITPESISAISKRMFTDRERQYIAVGSKGDKLRFLEIWTKKESIIKSTGEGLSAMAKTDSIDNNIKYLDTQYIKVDGKEYILSITGI